MFPNPVGPALSNDTQFVNKLGRREGKRGGGDPAKFYTFVCPRSCAREVDDKKRDFVIRILQGGLACGTSKPFRPVPLKLNMHFALRWLAR